MKHQNGSILPLSLSILTAGIGAVLLVELRGTRRVPVLQPVAATAAQPLVDVVIPARDEVQRLPRLLHGLAAQTSRRFHVWLLDDNSTDGTAAFARTFAPMLPALDVLAGTPLPADWSGKCWACWQAANHGDAPWLLFLDADTAPDPALISTLVAYAERHAVDLLTIAPLLELETFWERVIMPPFVGLIEAVFPPHKVNDPRWPLALANGQCILIRRTVYQAVDGHRAIRRSILEDVELGQLVKSQGHRLVFAAGGDLLRVRMYTQFSEVSEGLRKNAWAGYSAGGLRSLWGGLRQGVLACAPWQLLGAAWLVRHRRPATSKLLLGHALAIWLMTTGFWSHQIRRLNRLPGRWAVLYPLGTLVYFALAGWAWLSLRLGRGVAWKGRKYGVPDQ